MIKILAIDDKKDNLISLEAIIKNALSDTKIITALSGAEGITLALAEDPDVILLDIVMPEMDGFEVCQILKQDERNSDIPIIFLTAIKADRENRIKALEVGADAILTKPIDDIELIAQIRAMVKIKSANRIKRNENERLEILVAERTKELNKSNEALLRNELDLKRGQEIAHMGFWTLNTETMEISGSDELLKIFELDKGELTIDSFLQVVHPNDRAFDLKQIENGIKNGIPWDIEHRLLFEDGSTKWVHAVGEPQMNEDKKVLSIIGIVQDITEQKLSEKKSKDSEEKFRSIIEQAGDAVYLSDFEGNILLANKNACEMLGYSNEELIGMKVGDLDIEYVDLKIQQGLWNTMVPGQSQTLETKHKHKNGKIIPVEIRFGLFENEGKKNILGFARDVTERKLAQSMLQESQNNLAAVFNNTQDAQLLSKYAGENDFIIVAANSSYIKKINKFGIKISESDIIGISLKELLINKLNLSKEVFDYTIGFYLKVVETKNQIHHNEHFVINEDNYFSETSYSPIHNTEKRMSYVLYNSHDTTEKRIAEEKVLSQLTELQRWHDAMINREEKTLELKQEVNDLLKQIGKPIRYSSVDKEAKKNENQNE